MLSLAIEIKTLLVVGFLSMQNPLRQLLISVANGTKSLCDRRHGRLQISYLNALATQYLSQMSMGDDDHLLSNERARSFIIYHKKENIISPIPEVSLY